MTVGYITVRIMATVTSHMRELDALGMTYEKQADTDDPKHLVCEGLNDLSIIGHELGHALGKIFDLDIVHENMLAESFEAAAKSVGRQVNQVEQAHRPRVAD